MSSAIEFVNVGKQYRLGRVGTGTLQHDLNRWWQTSILGKEDPYLKIGDVNDRTTKGNSDYVWALKDINFSVEEGDVVGIIGKNGAGKSTLLKLLSHITSPSTGSIRYKGRIASLLEVGTGFHPELTARENIYMNGSIMGMTKHEIDRKLDEIVDFAGVERYLDTPVKRFSSGMTVRLGFAVAAFLEPEILVVDEVLAVGDAEFQKKAIGKMQEVSQGGGRTVLFVSHNMAAIRNLCKHCILLKNGLLENAGDTNDIVSEYISGHRRNLTKDLSLWKDRQGNGVVKFKRTYVTDTEGNEISMLLTGSDVVFNFEVEAVRQADIDLGFSFTTIDDVMVSNLYSSWQHKTLPVKKGTSIISCTVRDFPFASNELFVRGVINVDKELSDWPSCHLTKLQIEEGDFYHTGNLTQKGNQFLFRGEWNMK